MVAFRADVPAPAFTPRPFGLLSTLAAETRTPSSPHWQTGVTYDSVCALGATTYDECFAVSGSGSASAGPPPSKAATTNMEHRGATAFVVYTSVDCSPVGFWDDVDAIGARSLTQAEQFQVERAFWTGLAAGQPVVFPHLAENAAVVDEQGIVLQTAATVVVSGSTALDVVEGMGRLEAALGACYDGVGVIHVPLVLEPALANAGLLVREGQRYRTPAGNVVVLGAGYTGSSPAGVESSSSAWVYATGAMFAYRGPLQVVRPSDAFDRSANNVRTLAERAFLLGWECCHLAVNITVGGVVAGAAGTSS